MRTQHRHAVVCAHRFLAAQTVVDPEALGQRCNNLETVHTPGVGHFNQLLAPDAVNDAMEKFVARL